MNALKAMRKTYNQTILRPTANLNDESLLEWLGISGTRKNVLSEVTYFTCLKLLSETLGKLPLKLYQNTASGIISPEPNNAYRILHDRPNDFMTPSIFWATVENNRNHYGNAYVYIREMFKRQKYGGTVEIKDIWIMPSESVKVLLDDAGIFGNKGRIWYWYQDKYSGEDYVFSSSEVMHFKTSLSFDGITGLPVREILKTTIAGGLQSQEFINNLNKGGLTARAALQYTGELNPKMEKKLVARFEEYANGVNNAGKFIPIPIGMKIEPLNIKLTDAQFYELKKYSALQIAGAFGIKPNQINDYEKSSYSNSEMQNLSFYVDTELFILKQYEEELRYKMLTNSEIEEGKYFKFNENAILRTDARTQQQILCGYVQNGIRKPNEARNILDLPMAAGGDELMCNGNYIRLTELGNKDKGGE